MRERSSKHTVSMSFVSLLSVSLFPLGHAASLRIFRKQVLVEGIPNQTGLP